MSDWLKKWFDIGVDRRTIIVALLISIMTSAAIVGFNIVSNPANRGIVAAFSVVSLIALALALRGYTAPGKWVIPFAAYAVISVLVFRGGIRDDGVLAYPLVILIAGLFLGQGGSVLLGVLSSVTAFAIGYAEATGMLVNPLSEFITAADAFVVGFLLLGQTGLQTLIIGRLRKFIYQAEQKTLESERANQELVALQQSLETRIQERTSDLARTTLSMEHRAGQLQAVSDVARSIATEQNLDALLPHITHVISNLFGFYHVGIFLLDEKGEYAELRAANSEGGQRMLARGHRLRVGYQGVVGFAARQGRARIALDTGEDAVFFDNPDLPATHSEAALPMILNDQVIGVLDVQSETPEAFTEEDLNVLDTLAFQVAIAIQNARLLDESRRALEETRRASRQQTQARWSSLSESGQKPGYRYDGKTPTLLLETVESPEINQAMLSGANQQTDHSLTIPVRLRGETIGIIGLTAKPGRRTWSPGEINLAQAAAERAALALENARLIEEAERRAALERMTAEITGKIGASVQYRSIMRIAAEELSRALGSEVLVQIQPEETKEI